MHCGSLEILLSDSVEFAKKFGAEIEVFEDMFHVFQLAPYLPEAKMSLKKVGEFIHKQF